MKLNTILGLVAGLAVSNVFAAEAGFPGEGYDEDVAVRAAIEASLYDLEDSAVIPAARAQATRPEIAALFADVNAAIGSNDFNLIQRTLSRVQDFTLNHELTAEQAENISEYMASLVIAQSDIESKAKLGAERASGRSLAKRPFATASPRTTVVSPAASRASPAATITGERRSVADLIARFGGK